MSTKFSVTIPAYKSQFLQEAIESVVSQTYTDWELIIVDDCSPEDLHTIVKPYLKDERIHYYRNEGNCGAANVVDNWNICLSYRTGDYVICMGDDDRLLPCCLSELGQLINKYPNLNVYHSQTEIIDEDGLAVEKLEMRPEREDALSMITRRWEGRKQFIGDFCYTREHLVAQGGYYPIPFAWGSDDVTAFRAATSTGIANTQKVGFQYRENRKSISLSHDDAKKVESVLLQREWFQQALHDSNATVDRMNSFMTLQISHHIFRDMKYEGFSRYLYWCGQTSRHGLSLFTLTKLYVKTLIS